MKLRLIRHCESEHNALAARGLPTTGLEDCGLTARGVEQAREISGEYDAILLSPMRRCIETFRYSNLTADRLVTTPLLREYRQDVCDFFEGEPKVKETEPEVLDRIETLKQFIKGYEGLKVCCITHGDLVFYWTAKKIDGEWFGQHLANGESIECTR